MILFCLWVAVDTERRELICVALTPTREITMPPVLYGACRKLA
jgi:hypothetical protein